MKLNLSNNKKNESANVQTAQVNNNNSEAVMHKVDVIGMMTALKRDGHVKLSDHFKDAEVVEPISEVKAEEPKAKPVTLKKKVTIKKKTAAPKPTANSQQPTTYSVVLLPTRDGGQWPKLYGFANEQQAKAMAERMPKSVTASWDYGPNGEGRETKTRHWCLKMGKRYCGVAKALCAALNSGDKKAINKAVTDSMGVYDIAKAEGQAEREARKAEREAEAKAEEEPAPAKTYTAEEVAAMLEAVCNGGMVPENVRKHIKQAA